MLASEYINELRAMIDIHGDLPVVDSNDNEMDLPEFSDDSGEDPAFVLAAEA